LATKIVLGYDGSENARRALDRTIELARSSDAELVIVYYVDIKPLETFAAKRFLVDIKSKMVEDAMNLVSDASQRAKQVGVKNIRTSVLQDGDPADAILSAALTNSADLIVVGRRGIRGIERFLLGSVSSRVVDHATCDVLVVK